MAIEIENLQSVDVRCPGCGYVMHFEPHDMAYYKHNGNFWMSCFGCHKFAMQVSLRQVMDINIEKRALVKSQLEGKAKDIYVPAKTPAMPEPMPKKKRGRPRKQK